MKLIINNHDHSGRFELATSVIYCIINLFFIVIMGDKWGSEPILAVLQC